MHSLRGKQILVGISGGIAAYKSAELVRQLIQIGAQVRVVMTASAQEFITPLTLQCLSGNPVHVDLFDAKMEAAMGHIALARWADAILIAPATADLMAKLAHGQASDLLTTLVLATHAQCLIAPAMNQGMWADKGTQNNVQILRDKGFVMVGPDAGVQACGDTGYGRMCEPEFIVTALSQVFEGQQLSGVRLLVTAGPTRENIDPVRFLSNHSSGKMGFALAQSAQLLGANVTLVAGPVHLDTPDHVQRIDVISAADMLHSCESAMPYDLFIATAAVADYRAKNVQDQKIKKNLRHEDMQLHLTTNADILKTISHRPDRPFCVGFAAETQNLIEHATAKLIDKGLDMIVANDVANKAIGFNSDENAITVIDSLKVVTHFAQASKSRIAHQLMLLISKHFWQVRQNAH